MERDRIIQGLKDITAQHGPWTAHYIRLADGLYTMESYNPNHVLYLRRITQVIVDTFGKDLSGKRFLDLGCLEGGFAVELAMRGAEVVALDARESNLVKLQFVKEVLGLSTIRTECSDARKIIAWNLGYFDAILCLGLLYHFEFEAIPPFLANVFAMTKRLAIFDTHISLSKQCSFEWKRKTYTGALFKEHDATDSQKNKADKNWASLDNDTSFFPTKDSLLNLLADSGFTSAYLCEMPYYRINRDRVTVVAPKSELTKLLSIENSISPSPAYPSEVSDAVVDSVNGLACG